MRKTAIPLMLFSMLSVPAFAAGQMKPGLWEMTMKSDAMKNMPKMSPEQMEQMKKMGVNVPHMQDGAMVHKVCITKDMMDGKMPPGMDGKDMGCQTKNMQQSGNSYSADVVCNNPQMKGEGKVKGTFSGDTAFNSTYEFKGTMHGQPVNQRHENSGKWLAADCGNVAPAGRPMPKK